MLKRISALTLALSTCATLSAQPDGFQCSAPSKPNDPAMLERINGQLPDVSAMTNMEKLTATIDVLRREGMQKTRMVDHLVSAYCGKVAEDTTLTGSEKHALLQRFTGQVTALVYSLGSGLQVIVNVPLTPDILDAVTDVAKQQGLSAPAWIAVTIDNALDQRGADRRQ